MTETPGDAGTVRRATAGDIPRIVEMARMFHGEATVWNRLGFSEERVQRLASEMIHGDEYMNFLALAHDMTGRAVGMICLLRTPAMFSDDMLVSDYGFWVEPDRRSERHAAALLAAGIEWARPHPLLIGVTAGVDTGNQRAIRFLERNGFRNVGAYMLLD